MNITAQCLVIGTDKAFLQSKDDIEETAHKIWIPGNAQQEIVETTHPAAQFEYPIHRVLGDHHVVGFSPQAARFGLEGEQPLICHPAFWFGPGIMLQVLDAGAFERGIDNIPVLAGPGALYPPHVHGVPWLTGDRTFAAAHQVANPAKVNP